MARQMNLGLSLVLVSGRRGEVRSPTLSRTWWPNGSQELFCFKVRTAFHVKREHSALVERTLQVVAMQ